MESRAVKSARISFSCAWRQARTWGAGEAACAAVAAASPRARAAPVSVRNAMIAISPARARDSRAAGPRRQSLAARILGGGARAPGADAQGLAGFAGPWQNGRLRGAA